MIYIKKPEEIQKMRHAGHILSKTFDMIAKFVQEGTSTAELNSIIEEFFLTNSVIPSFKGYNGFPAASCISINDVVVHGIPSNDTVLKNGDIVGIDIGTVSEGWNADAARTFAVGKISGQNQRLIQNAQECFFKGIDILKDGVRLGDLSATIQLHAESNGYSVVRALSGHGIGKRLHEDPQVPNFGKPNTGVKLSSGMTIAIEPMINIGGSEVMVDSDGWTVRTKDGSNSSHYENTVLITESGVEILTIQ